VGLKGPCTLAVTTIAWAQSGEEERRLLHSLARLCDHGYPTAIAVRQSSPEFTDALRALPHAVVGIADENGLVGQVRNSFRLAAAYAAQYFVYVEPDKEEFFINRFSRFVERAIEGNDARLVLASRSPSSLRTFPPIQQYTEGVFNHLCGDLIGVAGDYAYGPFLMHRALLPHIAGLPSELGWGWRPATFLAARRQGHRVVHVEDEHPCPADQRSEDAADRSHRLRQLAQNITGLIK
jgi:hypothetical protein